MAQLLRYILCTSILGLGLTFTLAGQNASVETEKAIPVESSELWVTPETTNANTSSIVAEYPFAVSVQNGMFVVYGNYSSLRVYNMLGQEIRNENLPEGLYILRIVANDTLYTIKAIMK